MSGFDQMVMAACDLYKSSPLRCLAAYLCTFLACQNVVMVALGFRSDSMEYTSYDCLFVNRRMSNSLSCKRNEDQRRKLRSACALLSMEDR